MAHRRGLALTEGLHRGLAAVSLDVVSSIEAPAAAPQAPETSLTSAEPAPPVRSEVLAGLGVAVTTALLGAPVGLLWAALAPHAVVRVQGGQATVVDPLGRAFITADLWFLTLALIGGVLTGLVVLLLRRHPAGPVAGPVLGLAVGGLLAAEIARRTGHLVGLDAARALVRSGRDGQAQVAVRLRSWQGLLAWPVAALATNLVGLLVRHEPVPPHVVGPWAPPPQPRPRGLRPSAATAQEDRR